MSAACTMVLGTRLGKYLAAVLVYSVATAVKYVNWNFSLETDHTVCASEFIVYFATGTKGGKEEGGE